MTDNQQPIVIDGDMDCAVHDWLSANLGRVVSFRRHARWRIGWDVLVEVNGQPTAYYIRGPRGDNYVSPIDMAQEAAIHRAYLANGIPAPRPIAVIDDPCSLVLERLPGTINTETIANPAARQRVREEFIEIIARQHQIPLDQFAEVGLDIPVGADAVSRNLYAASEAIFDRLIGRPWPLVRFVGRWLKRHVPQDRTRAAFINGDAGQFMFEGDRVTGLIDFEMSAFGDPAAELAGMRLRDTSEPLGNLSALYDHYEKLSGDRIPKALIEYHTAGFCGVNGFMLWPLAFSSTREQDYMAYMQFAVATSRWCVTAMAEHGGITLTEPPVPEARPMGFAQAGSHLVRQIADLPAPDANAAYARESAAALAQYQQRWLTYGASVLAADLADCETLTGIRPDTQDEMMQLVEAHVLQADASEDPRLIQHFHNWLRRQDFLLTGCGTASSFVGLDLQLIPAR
ncbi:MAG: phosphotransferase [Sphingomonadales bacterium]|nr:phosphotransferase [Sphingomonadales bacterium]MBK6720491.1 phosphotransferase [Sphingomonadales bacterium]MBK8861074.1 phosphotransferase [Sphingomonadales bacterium]MBK9589297.1 phosphotransferase [Sphingomonadales bacterium]MCC6480873.1 phosphotransferase [Sphingomonadaceae bacterium]